MVHTTHLISGPNKMICLWCSVELWNKVAFLRKIILAGALLISSIYPGITALYMILLGQSCNTGTFIQQHIVVLLRLLKACLLNLLASLVQLLTTAVRHGWVTHTHTHTHTHTLTHTDE